MSYFGEENLFRRKVPAYETRRFQVNDVKLIFRSPFPVTNVIKRLLGFPINSSRWAQEFYEENVSPMFGCYEVQYTLVKLGAVEMPEIGNNSL